MEYLNGFKKIPNAEGFVTNFYLLYATQHFNAETNTKELVLNIFFKIKRKMPVFTSISSLNLF